MIKDFLPKRMSGRFNEYSFGYFYTNFRVILRTHSKFQNEYDELKELYNYGFLIDFNRERSSENQKKQTFRFSKKETPKGTKPNYYRAPSHFNMKGKYYGKRIFL